MDFATRLNYARAAGKPVPPLKKLLVDKLWEFIREGKTTIGTDAGDRTFSTSQAQQLSRFLLVLSLQSAEVGVAFTSQTDSSASFMVGEKVHQFLLDADIPVIVLMNCEGNVEQQVVCTSFGLKETRPASPVIPVIIPLAITVFIDEIEAKMQRMRNPLTRRLLSKIGPIESLNVVLLDSLIGEYVFARLFTRSGMGFDAQEIKEIAPIAFSIEPRIAFLEWFFDRTEKEKKWMLAKIGLQGEEQVLEMDQRDLSRINIFGNAIFTVSMGRNNCGNLSIPILINLNTIADLTAEVLGRGILIIEI